MEGGRGRDSVSYFPKRFSESVILFQEYTSPCMPLTLYDILHYLQCLVKLRIYRAITDDADYASAPIVCAA